MIKVSILMNGYNAQKYLAEAIDSIYAQTFDDWEIIFIDNCSIDDTKKIVDSYDDKIKYYQTDINITLSQARSFGLQYCQGEYLAFLDTDDIWLPDKLSQQITQLDNNHDYQMSYSGGYYVDKTSKITQQFTPKCQSGDVLLQQLVAYEINMQSVMLRNNQEITFDKTLEFSPDYDLFMQICAKHSVGVIAKPLVKYRQLANSLTSKKISLWATEMKITLDKIFQQYPNLKTQHPKHYKQAYAKVAYHNAQYLISIGKKTAAIKVMSPYKYTSKTYFLLFLLSVMPVFVWRLVHKFK